MSSAEYWEQRYRSGRTSGRGSYGKLAEFKAEVINRLVRENKIRSVLDLGCGDGNQLGLFQIPVYTGLDVSEEAVRVCSEKYKGDPTKTFQVVQHPDYRVGSAELTLSLDVIFHLVEDEVYLAYMEALFRCARRFVAIYSSNFEKWFSTYERQRKFTDHVETVFPEWRLAEKVENPWPMSKHSNGSLADFYIYVRS